MSNIVVPATFQQGGPAAIFQGHGASEDLSGGITGGYGLIKYRGKVWSILYNGNSINLMRDDGDGPRGSIDVVILKANPQLSKTYYINGWDENNNNPPDCASANGVVPDQGVPHPQSTVCATCPRNAWGSAPGGGKGKACGDHRRLAVVPLSDLRNETFGGPLLLRCPAASLQDMAAFDSRYKGMGYPYFTMGIKIGFDPAESYPKFTFQAIRPLNEVEGAIVMEMRNSPETARVVHEIPGGVAPAQIAPPAQQGAFLEAAPAQPMVNPAAAQPQQVSLQPVAAQQPVAAAPVAQPAVVAQPHVQSVPRPAVAPAPHGTGVGGAPAAPSMSGFGPAVAAAPASVAQPAPQPAPRPVAGVRGDPAATGQQPAAPAPASAGGFGPGAVVAPQPAPQPASAGARPQVAMTGFGPTGAAPVTPEVTAPQPAPAPAASPVPLPTVSDFEGSIDERLNALLGS